jgi:hypothetical protein
MTTTMRQINLMIAMIVQITHHPIDDFTSDDQRFVSNPRSSQFDAADTFQVKLHDLIMMHKASLQMFDDICKLVNDYTSSPDVSMYTKLKNERRFSKGWKRRIILTFSVQNSVKSD